MTLPPLPRPNALLITAGAGMGVDSGLPDFRGNAGFWNAYPAYKHLGLSFSDLANPRWFSTDPGFAWGFYGHRLNLYRVTVPHEGFAILRALAESMPLGFFVFTSNVDGQFQKAGFPASRITEAHGSIHHLQCAENCGQEIFPADGFSPAVDPATFRAGDPLPTCPGCGALARPNILMFGDAEWDETRTASQETTMNTWLASLYENPGTRLLIVECGAGLAIPTVRHMSEYAAARQRGTLVRINPRDAAVPHLQYGIATGALEGIRQLAAALS